MRSFQFSLLVATSLALLPLSSLAETAADKLSLEAKAAFASGDFQNAINLYSQLIGSESKDPQLYKARGLCRYRLKEYSSAIEDYSRAIALAPNDAHAYHRRAYTHLDNNEFEAAVKDASKALEIDPKYRNALTTRGNAKLKLKDFDGGYADYKSILSFLPNDLDTYSNLIATELDRKNYGSAVEFCKQGIALYERKGFALPSSATNAADPSAVQPVPADFGLTYANCSAASLRLGENKTALEYSEKAIALNPKLSIGHLNRAAVLTQNGELKPALAELDEATLTADGRSKPYADRGIVNRNLGKLVEAEADFTRAIELEPKEGRHYWERGYTRHQQSNLSGAIEDYHQASELLPAERKIQQLLIIALTAYGGYEEALERVDFLLQESPQDTTSLNYQAEIFAKMGNLQSAEDSLTKALASSPEACDLFLRRGTVRLRLGKFLEGANDIASMWERPCRSRAE
jgi:tetratricopeptide (TPR) repeat protein